MSRYLEMVDEPLHVKKLTLAQLQEFAEEIRRELITVLAKNGGHLGPNLGVVELTLALHYVFNTPKDKLVWDVSHQIYVHKLLTGRKDRFQTIRSTGGLSGWRMAGFGGFVELGANIIETVDGIGLLWFTQKQFTDFVLRVDWRASFPDDNSGVFITSVADNVKKFAADVPTPSLIGIGVILAIIYLVMQRIR